MTTERRDPMTPADIRALAAKATPGPWHVGTTRTYGIYPEGPTESAEAVAFVPHMEPRLHPWRPQGEADAAYVAALDPQTVLGMLDRLDALEAALRNAAYYLHFAHSDDIARCTRNTCVEVRAALAAGSGR